MRAQFLLCRVEAVNIKVVEYSKPYNLRGLSVVVQILGKTRRALHQIYE